MTDKLEITIHMAGEPMCKPGYPQLLCAPRDFVELRAFFAKHFDVNEFATGDDGATRYLVRYTPIEDNDEVLG